MPNHIIESISRDGVKTTPIDTRFLQGPKPGDPVRFPDGAPYPFQSGRGRVASIDGDRVVICCGGCSVFLNSDSSVSISGGPFEGVDTAQLETLFNVEPVEFWNWGDNWAGAAQGVDYLIFRPVWYLNLSEAA